MKRTVCGLSLAIFLAGAAGSTFADEKDATAIIDKAIKAIGGEEKLAKAKVFTTKTKGTLTLEGNDNDIKAQVTVQGLDHYRSEFEGEFNGNTITGVTIVSGDKGWRKFGDNIMEFDADALANEKRTVYLAVIPSTLVPLKGKEFKLEVAGEEKVADKPAVGLKITGPEGKDFKLYFDKESGVPVKLEARVIGFRGEEYTQQSLYSNYKDFDGIKKATKIVSTRDGEKFITQEVTDYKILDKAPADAFEEPK